MLSRATQRSQVTQYVVISMQVYFPNTLCTLYAAVVFDKTLSLKPIAVDILLKV
jgi:hypothetical protein